METEQANIMPANPNRNITKRLSIWAIIVAALLMIPFLLMHFNVPVQDPGSGSEQVNWTFSDFIFAGILLFGSAAVYEFATRNLSNKNNRVIIALIVLGVLGFIWVGAATGFEGILDRFYS